MKKLIRLDDEILVEVEVAGQQVEQISGGFADNVNSNLKRIKPILLSVAQPISEVWQQINKDMIIEGAEVELGLGFEAEGNIYITKSKTNANITVTLKLKPYDREATADLAS